MEREVMAEEGISNKLEVKNKEFTAIFLEGSMEWGLGSITSPEYDKKEKEQLAEAVLTSMVRVADDQLSYSGCTDGRVRLHLADGTAAPVREKLVGADIMTAFHMAETLGERFYPFRPIQEVPIYDRLKYIAEFLKNNGINASTHGPSCGAAHSYPSIVDNAISLIKNEPDFVKRQRQLYNGYDEVVHAKVLATYSNHLRDNDYQAWDESTVHKVVNEVTGYKGTKILHDDGEGFHGHKECAIVRVKSRSYTVDATLFSTLLPHKEQVFIVNDARLEFIASIFGRGIDEDYAMALQAGFDFQDAGHATLSKNLQTLIVTKEQ